MPEQFEDFQQSRSDAHETSAQECLRAEAGRELALRGNEAVHSAPSSTAALVPLEITTGQIPGQQTEHHKPESERVDEGKESHQHRSPLDSTDQTGKQGQKPVDESPADASISKPKEPGSASNTSLVDTSKRTNPEVLAVDSGKKVNSGLLADQTDVSEPVKDGAKNANAGGIKPSAELKDADPQVKDEQTKQSVAVPTKQSADISSTQSADLSTKQSAALSAKQNTDKPVEKPSNGTSDSTSGSIANNLDNKPVDKPTNGPPEVKPIDKPAGSPSPSDQEVEKPAVTKQTEAKPPDTNSSTPEEVKPSDAKPHGAEVTPQSLAGVAGVAANLLGGIKTSTDADNNERNGEDTRRATAGTTNPTGSPPPPEVDNTPPHPTNTDPAPRAGNTAGDFAETAGTGAFHGLLRLLSPDNDGHQGDRSERNDAHGERLEKNDAFIDIGRAATESNQPFVPKIDNHGDPLSEAANHDVYRQPLESIKKADTNNDTKHVPESDFNGRELHVDTKTDIWRNNQNEQEKTLLKAEQNSGSREVPAENCDASDPLKTKEKERCVQEDYLYLRYGTFGPGGEFHAEAAPKINVQTSSTLPVARLEMSSFNPPSPDSGRSAFKYDQSMDHGTPHPIVNSTTTPADQRTPRTFDHISDAPVRLPSSFQVPMAQPLVVRQDLFTIPGRSTEPLDVRRTQFDQPRAVEAASPALAFARQQILVDAISLKDLIANNSNKGINPIRIGDLNGADPATARALKDPLFTVRGGMLLDPSGKVILDLNGKNFPPGAGINGSIEPAISALKGADSKNGLTPDGVDGMIDDQDDLTGKRNDTNDQTDNDEDNSEFNNELIKLLAATGKVKQQPKPEDKEETTRKDEQKDEQDTRRKYVVREGDTLDSIAEKIFGDSRYSLLLEIVNRGYIKYHWVGAVRKPLLRVGQIIWLPTKKEVQVHQTLFFSRKNQQKNGKTEADKGNTSATSACFEETEELDDEDEAQLPELSIIDTEKKPAAAAADSSGAGSVTATQPSVREEESHLPAFMAALRHAGHLKAEPKTLQADILPPRRRTCDEGEQTWKEIQDLLNKMRKAAETGHFRESDLMENTQDLPLVNDSDDQILKQLDSRNRIIMETVDQEGAFVLRQEKLVAGEWKAIAYYEFRDGRCVRYLNKANGARRAFHVNLPQHVVREMALKDFTNNWKSYAYDYEVIDARAANAAAL